MSHRDRHLHRWARQVAAHGHPWYNDPNYHHTVTDEGMSFRDEKGHWYEVPWAPAPPSEEEWNEYLPNWQRRHATRLIPNGVTAPNAHRRPAHELHLTPNRYMRPSRYRVTDMHAANARDAAAARRRAQFERLEAHEAELTRARERRHSDMRSRGYYRPGRRRNR